jgi:hypothetical protein
MSVSDRVIAIANKTRHDDLCREIARDLPTFIRIGSRLKELQQLEVYKETHKSFEAFVLAEFGLSRARAYQLIEAAEVDANLSTIVDNRPQNEAQLREVAKAPPEQQAEVVKKAVEKAAEENRKPTSKDYKQAVKQVVGELVEDAEEPKQEPPPKETHHPKEMAGPLMAHVKTLVQMLNDLKKRAAERGGEWIDVQAISMQISALKYSLKSSIYYADCPACEGKGCEKCKQTGFFPELKSAILEELK